MKIWVDDIRYAPYGFFHAYSVNQAKKLIEMAEFCSGSCWSDDNPYEIEVIHVDHDAGDYACDGGDYIELLKWLEETGRKYPIGIHTMNPVGAENMRRIIQKNGWTEV